MKDSSFFRRNKSGKNDKNEDFVAQFSDIFSRELVVKIKDYFNTLRLNSDSNKSSSLTGGTTEKNIDASAGLDPTGITNVIVTLFKSAIDRGAQNIHRKRATSVIDAFNDHPELLLGNEERRDAYLTEYFYGIGIELAYVFEPILKKLIEGPEGIDRFSEIIAKRCIDAIVKYESLSHENIVLGAISTGKFKKQHIRKGEFHKKTKIEMEGGKHFTHAHINRMGIEEFTIQDQEVYSCSYNHEDNNKQLFRQLAYFWNGENYTSEDLNSFETGTRANQVINFPTYLNILDANIVDKYIQFLGEARFSTPAKESISFNKYLSEVYCQKKPVIGIIRVPLNGMDLSGGNFSEIIAQNMDFSKCNLTGTYFAKASLQYANFYKAKLNNLMFENTNLSFASFHKSSLEEGDITFNDTKLLFADLKDLKFSSRTKKIDVYGAKVAGTDFSLLDASDIVNLDKVEGNSILKSHTERFGETNEKIEIVDKKVDDLITKISGILKSEIEDKKTSQELIINLRTAIATEEGAVAIRKLKLIDYINTPNRKQEIDDLITRVEMIEGKREINIDSGKATAKGAQTITESPDIPGLTEEKTLELLNLNFFKNEGANTNEEEKEKTLSLKKN